MSRPSVFSRIASWLKNASNLNEIRRQKKALSRANRQYTVQTLEDRYMLDASFAFNALTDQLTLDNFSETFEETIDITRNGAEYSFTLSEGVWSGTDSALLGIVGNGSDQLRVPVVNFALPTRSLTIDDTQGIDIVFTDSGDFTNTGTFTINSMRGEIEQSQLSQFSFDNFNVTGAERITLTEIVNDFTGVVTITDTNFAAIRDANQIELGRIDINFDGSIENNGLMFINGLMTVGRDVLLNSNFGSIIQQEDSPVIIQGKTSLKNNANGPGPTVSPIMDLSFGDLDGDGNNDNDFIGEVEILLGSNIDIRDKNSITLADANTEANVDLNQLYVEAEDGQVIIDGTIFLPGDENPDFNSAILGTGFFHASEGVIETSRGVIIADALMLLGKGDFVLEGMNEIFDVGSGTHGLFSADVIGNLSFQNELDMAFWVNDFETISPGLPVQMRATKVKFDTDTLTGGNLIISTSDDNITQNNSSPLIVDELTTFDVGTGNITLNFGDELGDALNDNNWNRLEVLSGATISFVDENELIVTDINADSARFQTEKENTIFLDGNINVVNNVLFQSEKGLQQLRGTVNAAGLMAQGTGDFRFELLNELGDATTRGLVSADIVSGELIVENLFGLETASLAGFGESLVGIDGVDLGEVRLRGSEIAVNQVINAGLTFLESDSVITQTAVITSTGLMIRSNGPATLSAANQVDILAAEVEGEFQYNNDMELTIGRLTYDATTVAGVSVENGTTNNFVISTTDDDVHQATDAPILVAGDLDINIGLGCLGFTFGDLTGDTINDNDFNVILVGSARRIEIVDRDSFTTGAINVSEQIRLQSETGKITLADNLVSTNIVLLQAGDGVIQVPDINGIEGVIDTAALMLQGTGDFDLTHSNSVGDATTEGEIAVDIDGGFNLNNAFSLVSRSLSFEMKDGSILTINGFNINSGGDALVLNVNGLTIETEIVAPKIIINTTGNIVQAPTGRFVTNELVLNGIGDFDLNAMNQIGTAGTPGVLAINVEGNVALTNEFDLTFDTIVCGPDTFLGGTLIPGTFSGGDLTLSTLNGDITQANDAILTVSGMSTFDVMAGSVNLTGFVGNDNNFAGIRVDSADTVEIFDADGITLDTVDVTNNMLIRSGASIPSRILLNDNINVGNQLALQSTLGVSQQRGFITTDTLMLDGASDFDLLLGNKVNNVAANISGNLTMVNQQDLNVSKDTYTALDGSMISFSGITLDRGLVDGNLNLTVMDFDVTQSADAHVQVAETALFDLGSGTLDLTFGDSNGDTLNDNDLNVLAIASAAGADIVDANSISLDNADLSSQLSVVSEGGSISIQGQVNADDQIMLQALSGAGTRIGATLDTDELLVSGTGEFLLNGDNRIGTVLTPGNIAVEVDGDVTIHSIFALNFDQVSFTKLDGSVTTLSGADVNAGVLNGNLFVSADGGITDEDTVDILVDGHAAFIASAAGDVHLGGVNQLTSESISVAGQNATIFKNDAIVFDGVNLTGDLTAESVGDIGQSGLDVSGLAGTRFVKVGGNTELTVDSVSGLVEELDIRLLSSGGNLLNNQFGGQIVLQGSTFTGTGTGSGQLGGIQIRNSIVDVAQFPTINTLAGDMLDGLTVWAPNSSLMITEQFAPTDYDVINNVSLFAGVDSETGVIGDRLKVTDNSKTRFLKDEAGVSFNVGGSLFANAANTLIVGDEATDSILVGGRLSLVNQGGANDNRIRVGVGTVGPRGTDSGATVEAGTLRVRASRAGTDGHVTVNLDNDIHFENGNFATSLVVVSGGNITDDANTLIAVRNGAFMEGNDITIGDDNATNQINFGSIGFKGNNVSFTEDTSVLLNGSDVSGDLDIFSKGSIRQAGLDRQGRAGTPFLNVDGDATFTVDGVLIPQNHLQDGSGKDVMLVSNGSKDVMDNQFHGAIIVQSTLQTMGGNGTLRSVGIRNVVTNAVMPTIVTADSDPLKNLTLWTPNSSIVFSEQGTTTDYNIAGNLTAYAGVDTDNGKVNGNLSIVNDTVVRNIRDSVGVTLSIGRQAKFHVSNDIQLADQASNSLTVGATTNLISEGGALGNRIDVGTDLTTRGLDSGATFETSRLKFNIANTGVGGNLTVIADSPFRLDATSFAPSVVTS